MDKQKHWVWAWVGRAAAYAFFGALFCGLVGTLLIGLSGALTGFIAEWNIWPQFRSIWLMGMTFGAVLGGVGGAVTGAIAFGIYGAIGTPRRSLMPSWFAFRKVFLAMTVATVGVMTSYFVVCAVGAVMQNVSFSTAVQIGELFILFGAPATMICGQIAGAVWAFRGEKNYPSLD